MSFFSGISSSPLVTNIENCFAWYDASILSSITLSGSNVTQWNDLTVNGYNLTTSASPTYNATGLNSRPTITFSGSNQNLSRLGMGGTKSAFTVWSIINFGTNAEFHVIWWAPNSAFATCGQTNDLQAEHLSSTSLNYYQNNVGPQAPTGSQAIAPGSTYRVVHWYDGTTMQIFINNVEQASASVSSARLGTNLQIAGQRGCSTGSDWAGSISEMAFFSRALTTQELQILDNYGYRKWFGGIWKNNIFSTHFNGSTQKLLSAVGSFNYSNTTPFSFSLWIRPEATTNTIALFSHEEDANPFKGYASVITGGSSGSGPLRFAFFGDYGAANYIDVSTQTNILKNGSTWTHVVITYDGSSTAAGVKMYFNGTSQSISVTKDTLSIDPTDATIPLRIGYDNASTPYYYPGLIDEVSIWSVALSSTNVTSIYNSGNPANLTGSSNLTSWYRMGDGDSTTTVIDQVGSNNLSCVSFDATSFQTFVPTGQ